MNSPETIPTIMILDDDPDVNEILQMHLMVAGYNVLSAGSYVTFIEAMVDCDVVLCDIFLSGSSGLQALEWTHHHYPNTVVVMMTGNPSYETAAEAIRLGAYDYLVKPIKRDNLLHTLEQALNHRYLTLEKQRLEAENEAYRLSLEQRVDEQTQALRESEEFLTMLTNTMADAVLSLKLPDYKIEYANRAVFDIFGYQPEELQGQSISVLYGDASKFEKYNQEQCAAITRGQPEVRLEQSMSKKEGESVWTEMVTTFIQTDGHQPSQVIAVIRDITQRSFLLGVVAHELRGPLALLTGFAETIIDDIENIDKESVKYYLNTMNSSATRMLQLVDELLDIAKIELGDVSLQPATVDLTELINTLNHDYTYLAKKKEIEFTTTLTAEPLVCECDPIKIGQVLSNFIDNAIKYSKPNTTIEIKGVLQPDKVWVGVKDEGPGIKADEVQHLFTDFGHRKISSKPTAGERSTGLGLAICKKIIEAHQGQIGADSVPDEGSTFWFSLPAKMETKTHLN